MDAELDELVAECSEGDLQSCDELYFASPSGSDYEFFAATCGELYDDEQNAGTCAELDQLLAECSEGDLQSCDVLYLASPSGSDYEFFAATCGELYDDEQKAGSCAELDQLLAECSEGDLQSCDELYFASPSGSDYEFFAATCGELYEDEQNAGTCAESQ